MLFRSLWREKIGTVAGVETLAVSAISAAGGNAIDLSLSGHDIGTLRAASAHIREKLDGFTGVIDISDSDRPGKRELRFRELTPLGLAQGMSLYDITGQVRGAFYGEEVQRLQRGREEVKVMLRYPAEDRRALATLERMRIATPFGGWVPLNSLAIPTEGRGPDSIERIDRKRVINIVADVNQQGNANEVVSSLMEETLGRLPEDFPGVSWKFEGEQKDQNTSVREMGFKFLFALMAMYVLMAIPLRSYIQPLLIMSVVPFGIVGAIWGHIFLGYNLSIMSMCGVVALSGVVVNDSLVLVDYVNRFRRKGRSAYEAAATAGGARFRAIILTSLTTFAGLMPMLTETDMQARFLIPMAISLGFGILFATAITLVLVPSLYLILSDLKAISGFKDSRFPNPSDEKSRSPDEESIQRHPRAS